MSTETIADLDRQIEELQKELLEVEDTTEIERVLIDSVALLKVIKHCKEVFPTCVTGQLVGMAIGSTLEITNCFPFPQAKDMDEGTDAEKYQLNMMKQLREVNIDANSVGWYQSTTLGSHIDESLLATQFTFQDSLKRSVVLVYDPIKSSSGALGLHAFRLTQKFIEFYRRYTLAPNAVDKTHINFNEIFEELPIQVQQSALCSVFWQKLTANNDFSLSPDSVSSLSSVFEKNIELLLESIDTYQRKHQNYRTYSKREDRRKDDDEERHQVPSHVDMLVLSNQIDSWCQQIGQFTGQGFATLLTLNGYHQ